MPYIAIKSFPKDEATKRLVAEKLNALFLEHWGCPQEAITIGIEEIAPEDWQEKVAKPEFEGQEEKFLMLRGKWQRK